ncbi:MAG TPA: MoaD/ThiS family protein [Gemmatimonadales bacterium]|nr:MoaD/ThiS family protein [Gemmatimonadales bacterium]
MTVRVLLFALYADLLGQAAVEVGVPAPATVADVLRELRRRVPGGNRLPDRPLVALNQVHARLDSPVGEGDELAVLPPMAGG